MCVINKSFESIIRFHINIINYDMKINTSTTGPDCTTL